MDYPPITIGVVTYSGSFIDFSSFLTELVPAVTHYPGPCQLVVVNNSGHQALADTEAAVLRASINQHAECVVVASTDNNIAIGRNTVFDHAQHDLVALIDDDEFPTPAWLVHLVDTLQRNQCGVVAGPALPLYLFDTPKWIRSLDLHRANGKQTDQRIDNCPTANVLIDSRRIVGELFNTDYGKSGGEDSEFFLRQRDANVDMRWSNEAVVYEYIPASKSTTRYMIKRSILQGALNRRILTTRGDIASQPTFVARSLAVFVCSLIIGTGLCIIGHQRAGHWLQRAFGNLGHCVSFRSGLYPHA